MGKTPTAPHEALWPAHLPRAGRTSFAPPRPDGRSVGARPPVGESRGVARDPDPDSGPRPLALPSLWPPHVPPRGPSRDKAHPRGFGLRSRPADRPVPRLPRSDRRPLPGGSPRHHAPRRGPVLVRGKARGQQMECPAGRLSSGRRSSWCRLTLKEPMARRPGQAAPRRRLSAWTIHSPPRRWCSARSLRRKAVRFRSPTEINFILVTHLSAFGRADRRGLWLFPARRPREWTVRGSPHDARGAMLHACLPFSVERLTACLPTLPNLDTAHSVSAEPRASTLSSHCTPSP